MPKTKIVRYEYDYKNDFTDGKWCRHASFQILKGTKPPKNAIEAIEKLRAIKRLVHPSTKLRLIRVEETICNERI
jgi:hypothetical protein